MKSSKRVELEKALTKEESHSFCSDQKLPIRTSGNVTHLSQLIFLLLLFLFAADVQSKTPRKKSNGRRRKNSTFISAFLFFFSPLIWTSKLGGDVIIHYRQTKNTIRIILLRKTTLPTRLLFLSLSIWLGEFFLRQRQQSSRRSPSLCLSLSNLLLPPLRLNFLIGNTERTSPSTRSQCNARTSEKTGAQRAEIVRRARQTYQSVRGILLCLPDRSIEKMMSCWFLIKSFFSVTY